MQCVEYWGPQPPGSGEGLAGPFYNATTWRSCCIGSESSANCECQRIATHMRDCSTPTRAVTHIGTFFPVLWSAKSTVTGCFPVDQKARPVDPTAVWFHIKASLNTSLFSTWVGYRVARCLTGNMASVCLSYGKFLAIHFWKWQHFWQYGVFITKWQFFGNTNFVSYFFHRLLLNF